MTTELETTLHQHEQLFWLAARDIVFFSTYDETVGDWTDGWSAAVNCGDTFYLASADAEGLAPGQAHRVRDLYERYGWAGVIAWVAHKRGSEPLERLRDAQYLAARAELSVSEASAEQ